MAMFLSIFRKRISLGSLYCSNSQGRFEKTMRFFDYE